MRNPLRSIFTNYSKTLVQYLKYVVVAECYYFNNACSTEVETSKILYLHNIEKYHNLVARVASSVKFWITLPIWSLKTDWRLKSY